MLYKYDQFRGQFDNYIIRYYNSLHRKKNYTDISTISPAHLTSLHTPSPSHTLLLVGTSITSVVRVCITASPMSAIAHIPFRLTRMFLLFMSRWAMAGFPCVPKISVCKCTNPDAAEWIICITDKYNAFECRGMLVILIID